MLIHLANIFHSTNGFIEIFLKKKKDQIKLDCEKKIVYIVFDIENCIELYLIMKQFLNKNKRKQPTQLSKHIVNSFAKYISIDKWINENFF